MKTPGAKKSSESYIIGIGASAGGLEALQELFDNIPGDSGLAFVIIQHLSPDHKSLMGEILSKHTSMQVYEAVEGMEVAQNCVYLIPSKKIMTIREGRLMLEDKVKNGLPNSAIDVFFASLAEDKKDKAIAIILSGTGTDGTKGITAIKEKGGVVIVQDPMTAEFDGMPKSAISTGQADLILPPEMMADELVEYLKETPLIKSFNALNQKEELIFNEILDLVKNQTTHDFSMYKRPTLTRRLVKRMTEKSMGSIDEYYRYLRANEDEITTLGKEFLINVTKFFRDTDAFDLVSPQVLHNILHNRKTGDYVKIWVVACSTGEEAYSIAMLVYEYLEAAKRLDLNVKIFATDIDPDALNMASRGIYTTDHLKGVSTDRIEKFFTKEGNEYNVTPAIRKMIVFAKHNIVKDPPFSKIDFLSCRNMLIYMNPALQKSVIKKFHFALNEGGYLMLGQSENLGVYSDHFKDIDKKWKIYKCVIKSTPYDHETYVPVSRESFALGVPRSKNALSNIADIFKETLLEEHNYAGIYVDKEFEVKQALGNFKHFMDLTEGRLNFNLLKMVPQDLSIPLGVALRKAAKDNERVVMKGMKLLEGQNIRVINIIVKPYMEPKEYLQPFLFVVLEDVTASGQKTADVLPKQVYTGERVNELELELRDMKENLQSVIEEIEAANEELQASNEEIVSSNEELQSTNEELQSLNEELHTVNTEYQMKIKELVEMNDDQNNYFNNTDIGQILIDRKLMIRKFTPAATKQINLIASDVGRSIADISTNFRRLDFLNLIKEVIRTGATSEKEVIMENGRIYLMRINPYVRQDKTNDGVVVNFIDINETKRLNGIIEAVFNSSPNGIIALKTIRDAQHKKIEDFEIVTVNQQVSELFKNEETDLKGKLLLRDNPLPVADYFEEIKEVVLSGHQFHAEYFDTPLDIWVDIVVIRMLDGVVATLSDITQKKRAANMLIESFEELKRTSNELTTTNVRLEQSNYDLVQFASVASHDLKEPLRKIQVFGNFLKEKVYHDLNVSEKTYLDKIIGSSNRMQTLIEDVLTLSKLSNSDAGMVPTDLNDLLQQITDDLDIAIKEKNARIEYEDLPLVYARPGQMRQLFQNLISNSLKFSREEVSPVICIKHCELTKEEKDHLETSGAGDEFYCFEVTDNCIGFEEKFNEKVFALFQRLHGNIYPGTGLGLAICKKIVENHSGQITVQSKLGEGTTFRVILPKARTK
ncbi:MAG: chemotaxis protein CheB [Bacteroidota bacterium]